MTSLLLLRNARSGSDDDAAIEAVVGVLESSGAHVEVAATDSPEDVDAVLGRAERRTVVVAGGDGSLHAVVTSLHRSGTLSTTTLALIPLGTGNDFARGVGLPDDPADAAQVVADGTPRPLDLLVDADGGVVVNAVHAGVGAEAGRAAERLKPRLGNIGYVVGALTAGLRASGQRLKVEVDGTVVAPGHRRVLQVAIGNAPYVGGGTELVPAAEPADGRVDVVVSFAVSAAARAWYAVLLRLGRHTGRDDVVTCRGRVVRIAGEPFWCNADGELSGPHRDRTWTVEPAAYRLVVGSPR